MFSDSMIFINRKSSHYLLQMESLPVFEKKIDQTKKEEIPVSSSTGGWQRVCFIYLFGYIL